jgi:hypothetical protein
MLTPKENRVWANIEPPANSTKTSNFVFIRRPSFLPIRYARSAPKSMSFRTLDMPFQAMVLPHRTGALQPYQGNFA